MDSLFGVDFCKCDEPDEEVLDGIVFCSDCHGVIRLFILETETPTEEGK